MNAADALAQLFALQDKDLQLDHIREEQARLPEPLVVARKEYQSLESELRNLQDRLRELQLEFHRNDLEIKDLSSKQAKAKEAQSHATSSQEQIQYENRIRQIGDRISELEDIGVPMMEHIDELEAQIAQVKSMQQEALPRLQGLEQENQDRVQAMDVELQLKNAEREEMAAAIPAALVREYESIRKAKKGTGIAKTFKSGAISRCAACNVQLPPYVVQKVHQFNGTNPTRCPSCGRILWKGL